MENSNALDRFFVCGNRIIEEEEHLWFSSPEYTREIKMGKTLRPIFEGRKEFLSSHNLAMDLRVLPLTQTIRDNRLLPYDYYKMLDWIEHTANIRVFSKSNKVSATFGLHDKQISPFAIISDFLGQEIIDRKNKTLYQAIHRMTFKHYNRQLKWVLSLMPMTTLDTHLFIMLPIKEMQVLLISFSETVESQCKKQAPVTLFTVPHGAET